MRHDHSSFRASAIYSDSTEVEARVKRFLPLVKRSAWHIYGMGRAGLELGDLMQVGFIALVECARRHDGPGEDGFAAYAKTRVRGAMLDEVRRASPASRRTIQRQRKYDEAVEQLRQQLHRTPSRPEVARQLNISDEDLVELEQGRTCFAPLGDVYDESSSAFADDAPDPFQCLVRIDDRERVIAALGELSERLQLVLQLFYVEELNLTEIADLLDVSVPRVHQLRAQALVKLRGMLAPDSAEVE